MNTDKHIIIPAYQKEIWNFLAEIKDPEIPVLSIIDLGIVREVKLPGPLSLGGDEGIEVVITSTYTGCPAMDMIAADIRTGLATLGFKKIKITQSLTPAWTADWMSEEGKRKLQEYGIAPPDKRFLIPKDGVECPRCHSNNTRLVSEFGSTACKALCQCNDCKEPFDYFKCH